MVASQNGWRANDRSVITSYALPGGSVPLHVGSPGQVLVYVANRFHREVEPLVWPGCWGYAERPIRGGVELSNHASGTAIDLNAPKHPLGTDPRTNYTAGQIAAIHRIVAACRGLIRWGGDYIGRKDGMHFEVNDGVTQAQLDQLYRDLTAPAGRPTIKLGSTGQAVVDLQRKLSTTYPAYRTSLGPLSVDGDFGSRTDTWVREFQRRAGLAVDGIVGAATWHALGL